MANRTTYFAPGAARETVEDVLLLYHSSLRRRITMFHVPSKKQEATQNKLCPGYLPETQRTHDQLYNVQDFAARLYDYKLCATQTRAICLSV